MRSPDTRRTPGGWSAEGSHKIRRGGGIGTPNSSAPVHDADGWPIRTPEERAELRRRAIERARRRQRPPWFTPRPPDGGEPMPVERAS